MDTKKKLPLNYLHIFECPNYIESNNFEKTFNNTLIISIFFGVTLHGFQTLVFDSPVLAVRRVFKKRE